MSDRSIPVGVAVAGPGGDGEPGAPVRVPLAAALGGRGLIVGETGSGTTNTAAVLLEGLFDRGHGAVIVDPVGEYAGLKSDYELLCAGGDDSCDAVVGPAHADRLLAAARDGTPVALDCAGPTDFDARGLVAAVLEAALIAGKAEPDPLPIVIEEIDRFLAGSDDCARALETVIERGRPHGLGVIGVTDRPAAACEAADWDWTVWHRAEDPGPASGLDPTAREALSGLETGQALFTSDRIEGARRVRIDRRSSFDAGQPPGLDAERPPYRAVEEALLDDLEAIGESDDERADLEALIEEKNARIADLEAELERARDLRAMAEQFIATVTDGDGPTAIDLADGPAETEGPAWPDWTDPAGTDTPAESLLGPTDESAVAADGSGEDPIAAALADLDPVETTDQPGELAALHATIDDLDPVAVGMLAHYHREGPADPLAAHLAAGGSGKRTAAYGANRTLRTAELIEHHGRGRYDARIRDLVVDRIGGDPATIEDCRTALLEHVERVAGMDGPSGD